MEIKIEYPFEVGQKVKFKVDNDYRHYLPSKDGIYTVAEVHCSIVRRGYGVPRFAKHFTVELLEVPVRVGPC